jgi:transcriptional regulator of arginine metabolism
VPVPDKLQRQQLLRELLAVSDLRSQAEVRDALAERGIDAHQATVSRDLDELGAVKVRAANGSLVYRLAVDPGPGAARSRLDEVLRQYVTTVVHSGNLVVLRTPPACAHPVASAIDLAELDGVRSTARLPLWSTVVTNWRSTSSRRLRVGPGPGSTVSR